MKCPSCAKVIPTGSDGCAACGWSLADTATPTQLIEDEPEPRARTSGDNGRRGASGSARVSHSLASLDDARFQEVAAAAAGIIADCVAVTALVTEGNTIYSAIVPDPPAAIISIRLSGEILNDSKIVYLESLGKLRFEEMGRFAPQQFLEQAVAAAFDDYRANGNASALARRLRHFVSEDE